MRAWKLLLNTASVLALGVINIHLAYGSFDNCSTAERCTKVQECQEKLTNISRDDPEQIADFVQRKLCKFTMEGIHVCCPIWDPFDEKYCDTSLDKEYNGRQVYPWQAKLIYKSQKNDSEVEFNCSGVLISKYYVLTAAHCLDEGAWVLTEVWLAGDIKMPGSQIPVEGVIKHEIYVKNRHEYDIGLVKLRFPVTTGLISPICLSRRRENLENETFIALDFHGAMHDSKFVSTQGKLLVMNGSKVMEGDSGGALLRVHQPTPTSNRTYYLIGVYTGWHRHTVNDYFVNITEFLPWLRSRVNNNSN